MTKKLSLPRAITDLPHGKIPEQVTQVKNREHHHFRLSFTHYNENLCEIDILEKNRSKECVKLFKRIGQTTKGNFKESNIDRIPIENKGEYKKLFNRLDKQVEIFEHKIQGDARLFYFTDASQFHVVAITNNHLETGKNRR